MAVDHKVRPGGPATIECAISAAARKAGIRIPALQALDDWVLTITVAGNRSGVKYSKITVEATEHCPGGK